MNPGLPLFRLFLVLVAIAAGWGCAFLSMETHSSLVQQDVSYIVVSDSGLNGGAIGLGIISGMCFLGAAITFLKK